jgi:hypothetical protein
MEEGGAVKVDGIRLYLALQSVIAQESEKRKYQQSIKHSNYFLTGTGKC